MQDEVMVTLELRALIEAIINDYHTTRLDSDYVPHILAKTRTQVAIAKFEQSIRNQANEDENKWARIANDAVTRGLSLERELAETRHQAERETLARMEPVAWMYEYRGGVVAVTATRYDRGTIKALGYVETPLYALPPAPEAGQ